MCFFEWISQLFGCLEKRFLPNHVFASTFGNLLFYFSLDNTYMLQLRKLQRYNIYII
jgi:hypothetical protein